MKEERSAQTRGDLSTSMLGGAMAGGSGVTCRCNPLQQSPPIFLPIRNAPSGMAAKVKPHPTPEYHTGQGRHAVLPPIPLRGIILAPSGSGKTVLLVSMLLDFYRGAFARIYVFSPSVDIDQTWRPVKDYVAKELGVDPAKEKCFFDEWDPEALKEILETQAAMVQYQKKHKYHKIHGICVIVDDFADDPTVMHSSSNVLSMLFMRGRHLMCSTLLSTQKYRAVSTMIRTNAQFLIVFRLRNAAELQALMEETSALYDKKTLLRMYEHATDEPFSFWYLLLTAKRKEDMFYLRFDGKMVPELED